METEWKMSDLRMPKSSTTPRFRFTKNDLLAVAVPAGKDYIEVEDTEIRVLRCRIHRPLADGRPGKMTMLINKSVRGRHIRKTLGEYRPGAQGNKIEDFRAKARAELTKIDEDAAKWLEGEAERKADEITLEGAFGLALKASQRGAMARRDWAHAQTAFLAWMKKHHPYVTTWARLRRVHVREYLADQTPSARSIERGKAELSPTRKRLLLQPVAQTARYMWLEYELPNVAERLGLSAKLAKTPAPVYLQDVLAFLDYLKDKAPVASLEAGAALAGLAGLQLLEVLRLTWNKVDFDRGLVEISGEVKNRYRNRVIPIPARCVEALRRAYSNRPAEIVREIHGGHVVVSPQGRPFTGSSWMNYGKIMRTCMREWNPAMRWTPKDLRNCLLTLGAIRGFGGDVLEQYCGHAPRTVTARNYVPRLASASIGEAAQLEEQMEVFRRLVVENVEREITISNEKAKAKAEAGANVRTIGAEG